MLVSVLTATVGRPHLLDAYDSLLSQNMPDGWEWEWLVQEDSSEPGRGAVLPDDRRLRYECNGYSGGIAQTRNLALVRAGGVLVRNLDDDDLLTPTALSQDIAAIGSGGEAVWACSRAVDLMPDGTTKSFDDAIQPGTVPPGELFRRWKESGGRMPLHPATLAIRADVLRRFGGWMALPTSEDVGMLMAVSSAYPGVYSSGVSMRYRKHENQVTATRSRSETAPQAERRFRAIEQRAQAGIAAMRPGEPG